MTCVGEELGPSAETTQEPENGIEMGENLLLEQKRDLEQLQENFPEVFSKKPGWTNLVQHVIKVKEGKPVRLPP